MEPSDTSSEKNAALAFFKERDEVPLQNALLEVDPDDIVGELKSMTGRIYKPGLLLLSRKEIRPPEKPKWLDVFWINFSGQPFPLYPSESDLEVALCRGLKLRDVW